MSDALWAGEEAIALVVGGSRGIGRAIALRLARSGFHIWLTCHKGTDAASSVRAEIEALGRRCEVFAFDVADHAAVRALSLGLVGRPFRQTARGDPSDQRDGAGGFFHALCREPLRGGMRVAGGSFGILGGIAAAGRNADLRPFA